MDPDAASLQVSNVVRSFGRHHVLRGVTFEARGGEMVGIVGENGSGKTTLLRIAAGLLAPTRGRVRIRGRLGYCPQDPEVHAGLTVAQNLQWFRAAYHLPDADRAGRLLDQLGFRDRPTTLVSDLSGGTQQKLNLVLALMHDPEVLLLDEPYQGFDWETYLRFWEMAEESRRANRLIVVISHLVYERGRFTRILRLRDGTVSVEAAA